MTGPKFKSWSRKWHNLRFGCWNCWSYSNERHSFCKSLGYDVLALTELHNKQNNPNFSSDLWIPSAQAEEDAQGKCTDSAAGVAILLSKRMRRHIDKAGHVGTRIAWVRLRGPICPIFFIVVYVPHKYRTKAPQAADTLAQLDALIKTVPKNDCLVVCGDFNCQLKRNVPGLTGKWSMTQKHETKGHDQSLLDLMRKYELFAVDTKFKPKKKFWSNKQRLCNATYIPKHKGRRPTKLDYFLVSQRWQGSATASTTKWGAALHRFGSKFDHGLLAIEWTWRLRVSRSQPRPDFELMTPEKWQEFDRRLEDRLRQLPQNIEICEQGMGDHYDRLVASIQETVKEVVPPRKPHKFNGREVSAETKRLYDLRVRDFASGRTITKSDRDAWNRTLNKAAKKDYDRWVEDRVEEMEAADEQGNIRAIHEAARALAGKSKNPPSAQPTKKDNGQGDMIQSSEEMGELWSQFLAGKFKATELEASRQKWESLGPPQKEDSLTFEEFQRAIKHMKKGKATGPDSIPAEVWKGSTLASNELFFFLRHVWDQECIPKTLVLCIFVMLYKRKGSRDDPEMYRALGLLNHSYKILSVCLLHRMMAETDWFLSDWQAGFRSERGCRDNILLLRVIYDQYVRGKKGCVITYIDFAAAFDSVSHRFLDHALEKAKASRKTRAMFRAIYKAAAGAARIRGVDGKYTFSKTFDIARGVIQGDIISPIFFIIALDQLVQRYDLGGSGVQVGHIKNIRVLGYADDAAMCEEAVDNMSIRLTNFADAALEKADMKVKLAKTFSQHIQELQKVEAATTDEIKTTMTKYKHACEFVKAGCRQRFKTKAGMKVHSCSCNFNYGLTDKKWEVEEIVDVFGNASRKLFLVRWTGRPGEDSWEKEHSLLEDGCAESIRDFWIKSGKNPALDYYSDPDGEVGTRCWMCGWKSTANNKHRGLQTHIRLKKHHWSKKRSHLTERKDIKKQKLEAIQDKLPKVKWGDRDVDNCLQFPYLGSIFQTDADQLPDVRSKCMRAKLRAGTLRHIWAATLPADLKVRLYISACCSILVYGSEGWLLNEAARKCINGANAYMLSHITGKTKREEATTATTTFNIIAWIRARRLKWVGHILRYDDKRLIKQTLRVIFDNRQEGDILMDVPETSWDALLKAADDKNGWRQRVRAIKMEAKTTTRPGKPTRRTETTEHPHLRQRFTFLPPNVKPKKTTKKLSNEAARDKYYAQQNEKADELQQRINFFQPRQRDAQQRFTLPTWDVAAAAVFDSSSSSGYSTGRDYDSIADPHPKNQHSIPRRDHSDLWTEPAPTFTSTSQFITPPSPPQFITPPTITPISNDSDLWAEPIPQHMMTTPTPSPTSDRHRLASSAIKLDPSSPAFPPTPMSTLQLSPIELNSPKQLFLNLKTKENIPR